MRRPGRWSFPSNRLASAIVLVPCIALLGLGTLACPKKKPADSPPAPASTTTPAPPETPIDRAVALYDGGKYEEAKAILEPLDAAGSLTGAGLYRLGYCYGAAGDPAKQADLMARALTALQEEALRANRLEIAFFLANAQTNLGKFAEARATASDAISRIESGSWDRPVSGIDSFRVAKLYADAGRKDAATEWYARALERFEAEGTVAAGYTRWARRWLGQEAFTRGDFAEAQRQLAGLALAGGATAAEYDRLAVAHARQAHWDSAAEAWREAEKLDLANADRPRYARNAARLASTAGSVPTADPSGKPWSALSKEDLERTMSEQATRAREARTRAAATPALDAAQRKEITNTLADARASFAGAAIEYVLRSFDLRETAFLGGYAPLIFHPEDWTLPEAEPVE